MTTNPRRNALFSHLATASTLAAASLLVACSSSSSPTTPTDSGTGTPDVTTPHDAGNRHDTGTTTTPDAGKDSGTVSHDAGTTLYERLGGHAGIRSAVDAIVLQELENADINSYFFFQAGAPGNGHPTPGQIEECFTDLVANAAGGPEQYPTTLAADAGGPYTCRSMAAIHAPLLIDTGTFTTFVTIAGAELAALGVSSTDIGTLASALLSTESSIVTSDGGVQMYPGTADAAGPLGPDGSARTLYERLGGHAGIRAAINAIVAQELMNTDLASYFFFQSGAPGNGHPTADQIEECFTDLVGSAAGGPESYPTTITGDGGSYTCRDLTTAHRALQINTGTFVEFVTVAGGELAALHVEPSDITTLATALESFEGQVVTAGDGAVQPFPGNVDAASKLDATF